MEEKKGKSSVIISIIFLIIIIVIGFMKARNEFKNRELQANQDIEITEQNVIEETKKENKVTENNSKTKENTNTVEQKNENKKTNEDKQQVEKKQTVKSTFDGNAFEEGHLKNYPNFAEQYATLKISKIGIDAPIYYGATDEIILKGVGHDSGSYFAGENGTIIMCEHDYMNNFKRLGELKNGDTIEIKTDYGDFYYEIYDEQVVLETETDKLPIQKDEEILMLYTCYPVKDMEKTPYRYVVYAKKI